MMTPLEAATYYVRSGFLVVPIPHRAKRPVLESWQKLRLNESDLSRHFNGQPQNIGVLLGDDSGTADVDLDCREAIIAGELLLPATNFIFGRESKPRSHWFYRSDPPQRSRKYVAPDGATIAELRCQKADGGLGLQTVVPPSAHKDTGELIRFESGKDGAPANIDAAALARVVAKVAAAALLARQYPASGHGRHDCELALAGVLARGGWTLEEARQFVLATYRAVADHDRGALGRVTGSVDNTFENYRAGRQTTGIPRLAELIGEKVLSKALAWLDVRTSRNDGCHEETRQSGAANVKHEQTTEAADISAVIGTFRKWLHLPDAALLEILFGVVAANLMEGDPVWLLAVGPTGSGKTEQLQSIAKLPHIHFAATLTEASLLSGTPKKEQSTTTKGGLLRAVGDFGILLCKDFTSILAMNRDARASMLAALREVYDGNWTRHVGSDGGKALHWSGKLALIAGCTPTIDQHHAVMASMGERFLLYRLPASDAAEQAGRALDNAGNQSRMRAELSDCVASFFRSLHIPDRAPQLDSQERAWLIGLSTLTARCRSGVERDGYTREIELVPDSEMPGRLALQLGALLSGLKVVGVEAPERCRVVRAVALDCIPALRRKTFEWLLKGTADTSSIATSLGYPTTTTRRTLEDLSCHGVLVRESRGQGKADIWTLAEWADVQYHALEEPFPKCQKGSEQ
jgi:bifunctional DNA primase/polymerase-like protein